MTKPTPTQRKLLERLKTGPKTQVQILGSGGSIAKAAQACFDAGWLDIRDHPDVIDRRFNEPAAAFYLTDAGREAIGA